MNLVIIDIKNKDLRRIPKHILSKLKAWVEKVEELGIREVRLSIGYHDEPLNGGRKGQRSIRLSKLWRAIYIENKGNLEIVVIEVTPHKY